MDLTNWAFNAIFSMMRSGEGTLVLMDPIREDTTRPGHVEARLSVEDVEDAYITGSLVTESLLTGLGGYLF